MEKRKSRHVDRWWLLLLPIAVFVVAGQTGGTVAAASAGMFPAFIPMPGVTPRGVAVDKVGNVYVSASVGSGTSEHIKIWKFTPAGDPPFSADTFFADIGQGTIGGLAVTADGDLYVALAAGVDRGVWRVDQEGQKELLPKSNQIFFANGLAFDERGTLYATESVSLTIITPQGKPVGPGSVWRIPRGGEAKLWMRDELLRGTGALGQSVWIGANGIAYYHGNLYVTNTEKGTVMRIPVQKDGSAGVPEVWWLQEVPESLLKNKLPYPPMGDGLVLDVHGNLYVAVLTRSAVVRIDAQGLSQETVAVFPESPLDFPASLAFGTGKGERQSLFLSNLGLGAALGLPGPGLVKINAGVPGDPLH